MNVGIEVPRNELIENPPEIISCESDFTKLSHGRRSKNKQRILKRDRTCDVSCDIPEKSHLNMKLERRKERLKQEIVYFARV